MLPIEFVRLAQIIHEERTHAARVRRPEWAYDAPAATRAIPVWRKVGSWLLARVPRRRTARVAPPQVLDPASR